MADLDYGRLSRVLTRCNELAAAEDTHISVRLAWTDLLQSPAEAYQARHHALVAAESGAAKEGAEAKRALVTIDPLYGLARSVVQAYLPEQKVPDPLKSLTTDTDKKAAITALLDILDDHPDEPWAAVHLDGEFARLAPETERELDEWIGSSSALAKAKLERAAAYGPAWEQYLAYKNIVRRAYGAKSKQYRRIHVRFTENEATADANPAEAVVD
jgi:hypothetical protein